MTVVGWGVGSYYIAVSSARRSMEKSLNHVNLSGRFFPLVPEAQGPEHANLKGQPVKRIIAY